MSALKALPDTNAYSMIPWQSSLEDEHILLSWHERLCYMWLFKDWEIFRTKNKASNLQVCSLLWRSHNSLKQALKVDYLNIPSCQLQNEKPNQINTPQREENTHWQRSWEKAYQDTWKLNIHKQYQSWFCKWRHLYSALTTIKSISWINLNPWWH